MAAVSRPYIITPCGYKHCAHRQYFRRACGKVRRAERIAYDKKRCVGKQRRCARRGRRCCDKQKHCRGTCIIMRQTESFSIYILLYMAAEEKHANAKKCAKKRLPALTRGLMFIIFLLKQMDEQ